jgi:ribosome-associated protein
MIWINSSLRIPESELEFEFVRSAGPGGQNINKVATAAQLRFDVRRSPSLPEDIRRRLEKIAGGRLTVGGVLLLQARRFRTQEQNRADAIRRLREMIARAAVPPRRRKASRPTAGSRERRMREKRIRGRNKKLRGKVRNGEL